MANKWFIRCVIVTCLLNATVLLGGCSPPLPKTWLPPSGGTMYDIPMSIDGWHAMTATPLAIRR
jgi:hypothetical protein